MDKDTFHPNSYLSEIKNIKRGLRTRTFVLNILEKGPFDAGTIGKKAGMHYGVVMHHLWLLETEGIVQRKSSKPIVWGLTGKGQKRLINSS